MNIKHIKQIADLDEQETQIAIDYKARKLIIFTNRATVIKRLMRGGYKPSKVNYFDGEVESMEFEYPTSYIGKFLRTGIFAYAAAEPPQEHIEDKEALLEELYA